MFYELNHFGIVVRDLDETLRFYGELFGAEVVFQKVIEASGTDVVYVQIGGGLIEFLHSPNPAADEKFGITHVAFLTNDLDGDYARVTAAGVSGLSAPKTAGTGVGRLAFVEGPGGARVELIERDVRMRKALPDHAIVRSFEHYALVANDRAGSLTFYRDVLGMKLDSEPSTAVTDAADGLAPDRLRYDADVLELIDGALAAPVFSHIALGVVDVDEASAFIEARGTRVEARGTRTESGEERAVAQASAKAAGRSGVLHDPDGVEIVLVTP
jgi:catechol 2,3-dioxygenase-like lactoylglutathione lyase family enzyme